MHEAAEIFLMKSLFWVFIGIVLLQVVRIFQFEIEDAFDKVWTIVRKLLR